jgi:hypothetical protein
MYRLLVARGAKRFDDWKVIRCIYLGRCHTATMLLSSRSVQRQQTYGTQPDWEAAESFRSGLRTSLFDVVNHLFDSLYECRSSPPGGGTVRGGDADRLLDRGDIQGLAERFAVKQDPRTSNPPSAAQRAQRRISDRGFTGMYPVVLPHLPSRGQLRQLYARALAAAAAAAAERRHIGLRTCKLRAQPSSQNGLSVCACLPSSLAPVLSPCAGGSSSRGAGAAAHARSTSRLVAKHPSINNAAMTALCREGERVECGGGGGGGQRGHTDVICCATVVSSIYF